LCFKNVLAEKKVEIFEENGLYFESILQVVAYQKEGGILDFSAWADGLFNACVDEF